MPSIEDLAPVRRLGAPEAADWFWTLVDASMDADEEAQLRKLRESLDALPDQDLVDFVGLYQEAQAGLYSWRLWAAAYLVNGGCSDDGFIDFRAWLIARGRDVVERTLADADSLADLELEPDCAAFESFGHVGPQAFRDRSGGAFPKVWAKGAGVPSEPDWEFDFDDDAQMRRRLPRLAALYL